MALEDPICADLLCEGVTCELPRCHIGSHMRGSTPGMAALTWRSRTRPPATPQAPRVDYLELLRATRRSA